MPDVSVVICTYNRAESLRDTLDSLLVQRGADALSYEVVVVDNNSRDMTRDVAESYAKNHPRIRYAFEGRQGVAFARNTGIKESKGEIIAYLDDDVIADPDWLAGLWKCFTEEKDAVSVGGRVARKWNCEKPVWYSEELGGCLISQEFGSARKEWKSSKHMVTANMAFRRVAFERFGTFRTELGRRGESLVGGEDSEFYHRLVKNEAKVFYEPRALVYHKVEEDRLTREYMRRWFYEIGCTIGHEMKKTPVQNFAIAPLWVWKQMLVCMMRYLKAHLLPGQSEAGRFASETWLLHQFGIFRERFAHWILAGCMPGLCIFKNRTGSN